MLLALAALLWFRGILTPTANTATIKLGATLITTEIVKTPAALSLGLSGRAGLWPNQGMLFVFSTADYRGIWMKDMRFPIDIIWLDEQKKIVDIKANATPDSYPTVFAPAAPAKYVIEVNAGFAAANKLKVGDSALF